MDAVLRPKACIDALSRQRCQRNDRKCCRPGSLLCPVSATHRVPNTVVPGAQHLKQRLHDILKAEAILTTGLSLQVHVLAGAFTNAHVTALAWVHLLLLDIVQARWTTCSHTCCAHS